MELFVTALPPEDASRRRVEVVERKGLGHPDSICDALAEELSIGLSRHYIERYGRVLHHNVDKVLLSAGAARPAFGGGEVLEPMTIYLGGRAVTRVGNDVVPVEEIAVESARAWLRKNMRALDVERHVSIKCLVRPGSLELGQLFERSADVPLANDTSCGVGFAPFTALEHLALDLEQRLNSPVFRASSPAGGEDVKVMAVRRGTAVDLTVARAFIGARLPDIDAYVAARSALSEEVQRYALEFFPEVRARVNPGDDDAAGRVFLTVTGTSAEAGDDGEVGRGNRASGLITPGRPMSLEATAGKNPVSHVGKLYSLLARAIASSLVTELDAVQAAETTVVGRIGTPITDPPVVDVGVRTVESRPFEALLPRIREIVGDEVADVVTYRDRLLERTLRLF